MLNLSIMPMNEEHVDAYCEDIIAGGCVFR